MRILYMGKNKPAVIAGLEYLVEQGHDVVAVAAQKNKMPGSHCLVETAHRFGIPVTSDIALYQNIAAGQCPPECGYHLQDIDLVISYLFWKKIRKPLIELPKLGCINFHPAPLPDYKGLGGYNFAIYEGAQQWGVSAHFVNEDFDAGDLIKVMRFDINPNRETAYSLEQKSQSVMFELFQYVMDLIASGQPLPRIPQLQGGKYITRADFEALRKVSETDTVEEIKRKVRAFWYPPYEGAYVDINGESFTLVSRELLQDLRP